jgi:transforming growth factor-beta-induced protein
MQEVSVMNTRSLAVVAGLSISGLAFAQCGSPAKASGCGAEEMSGAAVTTVAFTQDYGKKGSGKDIVQTAVGAGSFNTLVAAVQAAGLVETLKGEGPFTVFAPTDEAFAKLPSGTVENLLKPENLGTLRQILTYHVVPGSVTADKVVTLSNATTVNGQQVDIVVRDGGVRIDNANVVKTDIMTSNGVIHVIDTVILPSTKNIVETADEAGSFSTLIAAAKAAGLAGLLQSEGPFTVFAPTDEAFAELGSTVNDLLKPENKHKLAEILKYHVVPGRVFARDAVTAGNAKTAEGGSVRIGITDGRLTVNDANIVMTDIDASNGVIHVIDGVLLPN